MSKPRPLKVLIVEDSPADAELVLRQIRLAGYDPTWTRVDTADEFSINLREKPEIVLSDYRMPQFDGFRALHLLRQSGRNIPFIIISGTIGEEVAVEAMRRGATDYLLKDRLARLGTAVAHALALTQLQQDHHQAVESLRLFRMQVDQSNDTFEIIDPATGRYLDVNGRGPAELGCTREHYLTLSVMDVDGSVTPAGWQRFVAQIRLNGSMQGQGRHRRMNGTEFPIEYSSKWLHLERDYIVSVVRDITERQANEQALQRQAAFAFFNPNPVLELSPTGEVIYANSAANALIRSLDLENFGQLLPLQTMAVVEECLRSLAPCLRLEKVFGERTFSWSFFAVKSSRTVHCYGGEITDRLLLESQLRQSQKMEAIGLLAGGIAHDFNNLLTAILGHLSLLRHDPQVTPAIAESLAEIASAANRASNLTRQLLAFSRRQVFVAHDLDLNVVVADLAKMLHRILGEELDLQLDLAPEPLAFRGDAGMIEQVLVNLAVNARDAMPHGGKLCIVTRGVTLAPPVTEQAFHGPGPAPFVRLSVADTGTGMDPEIQARIFEPFFTTKEAGRGTGLGLATVLGNVQQHHGWIDVQSSPGQGTTFHVNLPRLASGPADNPVVEPDARPGHGRNEVILLVEDDVSLLELVLMALLRQGYRVLTAPNGRIALEVWARHKEQVALLFTDMVMPDGVRGQQLAEQCLKEKPGLKVIYTSGYNAETAGTELKLQDGVNYLAKPYELDRLFLVVRTALDRPPGQD